MGSFSTGGEKSLMHERAAEPVWSLVGAAAACLVLVPCLVLLPLTDAALLVGGSVVLLLALTDPVWALSAAVLAVPLQDLVELPGGLYYAQAALLLLAFAWMLWTLVHVQASGGRIRGGRVLPALLLLLWFFALSAATTPYSQREAIKETLRWSTVVLVYLAALNTLATSEHPPVTAARRGGVAVNWRVVVLLACLLLAPAVNALVGLWQFATATGPESFGIAGGRFVRAYGTIGKPNSFAGYLNMGWPLAVALTVGSGAVWLRATIRTVRARRARGTAGTDGVQAWVRVWFVCSLAAAGILLAALGASFSRGGWVGAVGGGAAMGIALIAMLAPTTRRRAWKLAGVLVVAGGLLLVLNNAGVLPGALSQRIGSISRNLRLFDVQSVQVTPENFSVVERMSHLQAGWNMVRSHPFTGVGAGNFTPAYEGTGAFQAQPQSLHPWYTSHGHAHNVYLHIAAETGVGGLLAYLLLLALLVVQARATLRCVRGWLPRAIVVGCCGIIGAVAVHSLFENLHVLNMGIQLGAVWGLLTAMEKRLPSSQAEPRVSL